jgi:hypothetical protein
MQQYLNVKVDADLATEYCRKYRERFPESLATQLDDESFLVAFVKDRLLEELKFIDDETNVFVDE